MQTFDKSMLTNIGDSMQLEDERDGNKYTVKKLADGNVWMTQNLRIINKEISSVDSNLPSGESYIIPASNDSFTTDITDAAYIDSAYGGYYSFYTTTAGWGTVDVVIGNAPKDICPKGWRLPSSDEFQVLYNNYNSRVLLEGEPGFVSSGYILFSMRGQGTDGRYWSSSVLEDQYNPGYMAGSLVLTSNGANPSFNSPKYVGLTVRCITN